MPFHSKFNRYLYSPCALGASMNYKAIKRFNAKIIAGFTNNQLEKARHNQTLFEEEILYASDYMINTAGIINISLENSYNSEDSTKQIDYIYIT